MKTAQKLTLNMCLTLFFWFPKEAVAQELQEFPVTIQSLIDSLTINNPQLKLSKSGIEVAKSQVDEAKVNRLPNINFNASGSYLTDINILDKDFSQVQDLDVPHFGNTFNLQANQLIYKGGQLNNLVQLSELNKTLTEVQFSSDLQNAKLTLANLYIGLYRLNYQKQIIESNLKLAQERLKNVESFNKNDMVTKNEVLRAEVLVTGLKQTIIEIDNAIITTNRNLVLVSGLPENVLIVPTVENIHLEIKTQDEAFFMDDAFNNNPELKAGDIQIDIAEKNMGVTKAEMSPALALIAGYNLNRPLLNSSPFQDLYSGGGNIGLSMSYDLETLFKTPKSIAVDRARIEQAKASREFLKQQINSQVNTAYVNYRQAITQKEVSLENEKSASENYRITELKYKNQLVTVAEVQDAFNTKLEAELRTLDSEMNIVLNYVKLLQVTGKL